MHNTPVLDFQPVVWSGEETIAIEYRYKIMSVDQQYALGHVILVYFSCAQKTLPKNLSLASDSPKPCIRQYQQGTMVDCDGGRVRAAAAGGSNSALPDSFHGSVWVHVRAENVENV
ncbi:hypothetical protein PoB_001716000 [Plakobranchus ocellatus]|uniref:Uncharacterized protein n=1 Tax=Plakobranchus ocellatus TaxID=259542 RepID=A0AAV3Z7W4_9GAST|nr:hypothetical protein PoB_001716000 [Plakobranchus ocellatus]